MLSFVFLLTVAFSEIISETIEYDDFLFRTFRMYEVDKCYVSEVVNNVEHGVKVIENEDTYLKKPYYGDSTCQASATETNELEYYEIGDKNYIGTIFVDGKNCDSSVNGHDIALTYYSGDCFPSGDLSLKWEIRKQQLVNISYESSDCSGTGTISGSGFTCNICNIVDDTYTYCTCVEDVDSSTTPDSNSEDHNNNTEDGSVLTVILLISLISFFILI
ncbi:hypothetical protein QTN25_005085 [Entamoeba marina]